MAKKGDENLVVGLDIGTSKVLAIVGEVTATGEVEVIGVGHHPSRGMKKGVVVNIESTVQSIQRAIEEAELMAGCQIKSVYAGIAGSHIRSINSHGTVAIKDKEVGPNDIDRVIESARAPALPPAEQEGWPLRAAEFHQGWQGRHRGADRHERCAPGSQGAHCHRRGERGAE